MKLRLRGCSSLTVCFGLEIDNPDLLRRLDGSLVFLKKTLIQLIQNIATTVSSRFARDGQDKASFSVAYIVRA